MGKLFKRSGVVELHGHIVMFIATSLITATLPLNTALLNVLFWAPGFLPLTCTHSGRFVGATLLTSPEWGQLSVFLFLFFFFPFLFFKCQILKYICQKPALARK